MRFLILLVAASAVASCTPKRAADGAAGASSASAPAVAQAPPALEVTSTSFAPGASMDAKYTCQGQDTSPALAWSKLPAGTRAVAVVVDDPDAPDPAAPKRVWVHWVLYDLPPDAALSEGAAPPPGARVGKNDWGKTAYGGPCPPIGRHRYFHKVYALDAPLGDLGTPTKADLERAMAGHVLARGEVVGTYQKRP